MTEKMEPWINEVTMAFGRNWWFLGLLGIGAVVGLVALKGWRKALIVPGILITAVIMNPLFYEFWYKMVGRSYWRAMWALPIIPLVGIVPALAMEKSRKKIIGAAGIIVWLAVIFLTGSHIYSNSSTTFAKANNPEKLPDDVVMVGEKLLELDEYPRVVSGGNLSTYLRMYDGKIQSPYARSATYGSPTGDAKTMLDQLNGDNFSELATSIVNNDYEYLVAYSSGNEEALNGAGYEFLDQVNNYGIYRVHANRTEIREYNELGQVISITYVDENGNPTNTEQGYAVVRYTYPGKYEYYYDNEGKQLELGSGYLHDFFQSVKDKNLTVIIAVRDDASSAMTQGIADDMHSLGIKASLIGKYRYGLYAVITSQSVIEDMSQDLLSVEGKVGNMVYKIESAGMLAGDYASIIINETEYAKNVRGLNIVVYDDESNSVLDAFAVDTFKKMMPVYR